MGWRWFSSSSPLAGMISPLIFGAQVDQRLEAQKVLGWIMLLGAGFLYMAFHSLEQNWGGGWFLSFFIVNALISAPAWSLLTTITLSSLADPGKTFGLFRVWGTLGWMASSLLVSLWGLDFSAETGKLGAGVRVFARIAAACDKLLNTTLSVGQIANSLSYHEHASFTRAFSSVMHMSPKEYRNFYQSADL
ncbi:helix-turn-helix domain-containing protein [Akkermansiaceae bacterium]|nr:helix-turn-helix domain-containing protein [Akkermansiaceae bacterium]